jgi:hypothetical protein
MVTVRGHEQLFVGAKGLLAESGDCAHRIIQREFTLVAGQHPAKGVGRGWLPHALPMRQGAAAAAPHWWRETSNPHAVLLHEMPVHGVAERVAIDEVSLHLRQRPPGRF